MRRGCIRHSCALWEALGYEFVVGLGWESIQMCTAHAVAYPDDGPRHFFALDVDKVKEVSGVVEPAGYMHLVSIIPAADEKRKGLVSYGRCPEGVHLIHCSRPGARHPPSICF